MSRFLVHEVSVDGPATHVLILGVGRYPHLIGGDAPCQNPDGMGQLSSPPISARAMASWFIASYTDPAKPLASVALLLSEADPQPFQNSRTDESFEVEDATADNAEAAIRAWRDRANSDPGNRIFFYFCGHGVSEGEDMALLTSDFCSDGYNPLQGAIDLRRLQGGLKAARASEQVFFIDACRASSDVLISETDGVAGRVPLLPGRRPVGLPALLAVPYFATLAGTKAYARENSVSLFTDALLRSLRGAGSDEPEDLEGPWQVSTTRLQQGIDHFMKEPVFAGEIVGVQVPVTGQLPVFVLHYLDGPPEVPVYVGCDAGADNELAEFICLQGGAERARRVLAEVDPEYPQREWALPLSFGSYEFRAEFGANGPPRVTPRPVDVRPVTRRVKLKANP
jgi:Caspase domain